MKIKLVMFYFTLVSPHWRHLEFNFRAENPRFPFSSCSCLNRVRGSEPRFPPSCSDVPPGHKNETQRQKTNIPLPAWGCKDFLRFVSHSSQNKTPQSPPTTDFAPLLISRRCEHASTHFHVWKMLLKWRIVARIVFSPLQCVNGIILFLLNKSRVNVYWAPEARKQIWPHLSRTYAASADGNCSSSSIRKSQNRLASAEQLRAFCTRLQKHHKSSVRAKPRRSDPLHGFYSCSALASGFHVFLWRHFRCLGALWKHYEQLMLPVAGRPLDDLCL